LQDLYRGATFDRAIGEISKGVREPNEFGIVGGFTSKPIKARVFAKGRGYREKFALPSVVVFDDGLKTKLQPIQYDKDWLIQNMDVAKHLMTHMPKTYTDEEIVYSASGAPQREEAEWFSRKPVDIKAHIKHINVYIGPKTVEAWLKSKGIRSLHWDEGYKIYQKYKLSSDYIDSLKKSDCIKLANTILADIDFPKGIPIKVYVCHSDLNLAHEKDFGGQKNCTYLKIIRR